MDRVNQSSQLLSLLPIPHTRPLPPPTAAVAVMASSGALSNRKRSADGSSSRVGTLGQCIVAQSPSRPEAAPADGAPLAPEMLHVAPDRLRSPLAAKKRSAYDVQEQGGCKRKAKVGIKGQGKVQDEGDVEKVLAQQAEGQASGKAKGYHYGERNSEAKVDDKRADEGQEKQRKPTRTWRANKSQYLLRSGFTGRWQSKTVKVVGDHDDLHQKTMEWLVLAVAALERGEG